MICETVIFLFLLMKILHLRLLNLGWDVFCQGVVQQQRRMVKASGWSPVVWVAWDSLPLKSFWGILRVLWVPSCWSRVEAAWSEGKDLRDS